MKCPICEKSGIPDYKKNYIVCPQCDSDLKGFMLINKIEIESNSKVIRQRLFFGGISLILIILLAISILLIKTNNNISQNKNTSYYDSLEKIMEQKNIAEKDKKNYKIKDFTYIVKKGDNLTRIAKIFYNDGLLYKKIMADNNLNNDYLLKINDTLLIKLDLKNNLKY